ncbi:MAG: DUF4176 domain-containing protein [Lachnospiraceae bacterium]|nr:DUF4176 domain-containing protein [Lachnospiraceae bacterium]
MTLDMDAMNKQLISEWLDRHTDLSDHYKSIFKNVKNAIQSDLSLFYDMNRAIMQGGGHINRKDLNIEFLCNGSMCEMNTLFGRMNMEAMDFRKIITTFIEFYEPIYPIGTVVELKKEAFKSIIDISNIDKLKVVIAHRVIPISDSRFMPYIGVIYPVGPTGEPNDGLHFTPAAIEKVVHMGYADDQELAFLFNIKYHAIVEMDMHSTAFFTKEEYLNVVNNS